MSGGRYTGKYPFNFFTCQKLVDRRPAGELLFATPYCWAFACTATGLVDIYCLLGFEGGPFAACICRPRAI